jgi:hypothetical protein
MRVMSSNSGLRANQTTEIERTAIRLTVLMGGGKGKLSSVIPTILAASPGPVTFVTFPFRAESAQCVAHCCVTSHHLSLPYNHVQAVSV